MGVNREARIPIEDERSLTCISRYVRTNIFMIEVAMILCCLFVAYFSENEHI